MTTEATFPLIEDEETVPVTPGVGSPFLAPIEERAGYGFGLLVPFRRDARNDFISGGGTALLGSAILQVLGTRADNGRMTGELPWRADFGSLTYLLKFSNIDEIWAATARAYISSALATWVPQVKIRDFKVLLSNIPDQATRAVISLTYDVIQSGTNNLVARNQQVEIPVAA